MSNLTWEQIDEAHWMGKGPDGKPFIHLYFENCHQYVKVNLYADKGHDFLTFENEFLHNHGHSLTAATDAVTIKAKNQAEILWLQRGARAKKPIPQYLIIACVLLVAISASIAGANIGRGIARNQAQETGALEQVQKAQDLVCREQCIEQGALHGGGMLRGKCACYHMSREDIIKARTAQPVEVWE